MKRIIKSLLALTLTVLIVFGSFAFVSAEDNGNSSIIYFEAPDFWEEFENIYCHIAPYGRDAFANWHSEVTKCIYVSDNLYAYDVSKVCTLENGKYYSLIFSSDSNDKIFDVILSTKCIGDTLYCDGNVVDEPTSSHANTAYWKNSFPIMVGDTNLDERVTIQDATKIQKVIAFFEDMPAHWMFMLDTNGDSKENIKDATEIQKWIAKLPSNDKIGVFDEAVPESTIATEPSTTASEDSVPTEPVTTTEALSDPVENTLPSTTASSDEPVETTVATDPSTATDPVEGTEPEETIPATTAENTEPTWAEYDPYQKEVIEIFKEQGHNAYEAGMFYKVIYNYYENATADEATADEATPDYALIWTSVGSIADEVFEVIIGDYVLTCPAHCYPYTPGYYIYIPSSNTLMTIEEAYHSHLEGLETVFEEAPVFRPIEVDFKVIDEQRVSWYGSEKTELFLLSHNSHEMNVTSKFERGKAPEFNLPHDEKGFYGDKIYLVSLNFLGGGNSTQTIDRITVVNKTLTIYRTITSPELQTPDNNFQYVLIELDASLLESISELEDFTVKNII
ncbi:MAG: hypothetical protein IKK10_06260 [Clostridia bacterium]|nr:hypothetical protein [Clostridia bacterium]